MNLIPNSKRKIMAILSQSKKENLLLIMLWFLVMIIRSSMATIEITSGIYLERLPNVTFYQSTHQIIFHVQKAQSVLDKLSCRPVFCNNNPYICDQLTQKMNYFQYLKNNPTTVEENILLNDGELFDFQLATRHHLNKIFASDYEIGILMSKFSKRDHVSVQKLSFPNFTYDVINLTCTDQKLKELVILELAQAYESTRSLVMMCQLKRLAIDFMPLELLGKILNNLDRDRTNAGYVLALGSMIQLYTMPLVECIMSQKTLLVGIHIPLLKQELRGLQMIQALTPTYAWDNYTCSVDIPVLNAAILQNHSIWKVFVPICDPLREELCFVSDYRNDENLGVACIQQTLRGGSFKQFATNCPLKCRDTGNDVQLFTPVSSHRTLVTHQRKSLRLKCGDVVHPIENKERVGALSIDIPCNCHLEEEAHFISPTYPCVDKSITFGYHQLVPAAWSIYSDLSLPKWGDKPLYFDNLESCLNSQWIEQQFSNNKVAVNTYLIITLFLFLFILSIISGYQFYKLRTFNSLPMPIRTNTQPLERIPKTILDTQTNPAKIRRLLLHSREEETYEAADNAYLQPRQIQRPLAPNRNKPLPSPPITERNVYEPHPDPEAGSSSIKAESTYVKMDRIVAMCHPKNTSVV